jgi:hypothetical protein
VIWLVVIFVHPLVTGWVSSGGKVSVGIGIGDQPAVALVAVSAKRVAIRMRVIRTPFCTNLFR